MGARPADHSDDAVFELIFLPGFSTSTSISDTSGRGVGMDAMRTKVESLGGSLRVSSSLGLGTTLAVSLPIAQTGSAARPAKGDDWHASGTWATGDRAKLGER